MKRRKGKDYCLNTAAEKMRSLLFIFVLFLASCSGKPKFEIPDDVIRQDSMVSILIDIHILEAASQLIVQVDSQKSSNLDEFYGFIFKKHLTTKEAFDKSYLYYTTQPKLLEEIYAEVMIELSKKQGEVKTRKVK
jgi:hypothetical protein